MGASTNERELLAAAIEAVRREVGLELRGANDVSAADAANGIDGWLVLGGGEARLAVGIRRWPSQAGAATLIERIRRLPQPAVLVTDYINRELGLKLKESGIQFIDTSGNIYINQPPTLVLVQGNKPPTNEVVPRMTGRAFSPVGLRVVFGFLVDPRLIGQPYREIAARAGVAAGSVTWVIKDLLARGLAIEGGASGARQLRNPQQLLERWSEAYPERLRPKLTLGQFAATQSDWWRKVDIHRFGGAWGGEVAANHYTQYLQPEALTIYVEPGRERGLISAARLRKPTASDRGNIQLYSMFWSAPPYPPLATPAGIAPAALVYADLLATGDSRNREAAAMIWEQHLARYLGKN